jgi:hypothetical protein
MLDMTELAKRAYEAYGNVTDHKNHRGEPMPAWEDLGEKIQAAWVAAAQQVADDTTRE